MVEKVTQEEYNKVENLVIKKRCRVKEATALKAETKFPGDKVQIAGIDKVQLIHSGYATRDLNWKPDEKMKAAAAKGRMKSPMTSLLEQVQLLTSAVEKLITAQAKAPK